ncbi:MAG TPA: BON domain-containing protein [Chloroflexia bacterium]|nr:BON domain-containing protein [Chloroflexia bacterium]
MEDQVLKDQDVELARRVRDILAVATTDIDAVTSEVEDGIVYIEGIVPSEQHRKAISSAVRELDGVSQVITCLAAEHLFESGTDKAEQMPFSTPVYMHYYSLS